MAAKKEETDWVRYEKLVLEQLNRHEHALDKTNDVLNKHTSDIRLLRWQAVIISAVGTFIINVAIAVVFKLFL
jgi:hypothetical protein